MREKREDTEAIPASKALKSRELSGDLKIKIEDDIVQLTSLDKVYWPDEGYTKGDLIKYYFEVAEYILPYLQDRPLILKRYPNGIKEQYFFQHDLDSVPDFARVSPIESEEGRVINYVVCNNTATLLYLANLGTIAQHPWNSRIGNLDRPDWIVFDLDPEKVEFDAVCQAALAVKAILDRLGLDSYPKTSGSSGMHVYVPIEPIYSYRQVADFAQLVATVVKSENPGLATIERSLRKRKAGRVYVDHLQNARGKSVVAPYSVRERAGATVSAPLNWREVERKPSPQDFTIENMRWRLKKKGDLLGGALNKKQSLGDALVKLEKMFKTSEPIINEE